MGTIEQQVPPRRATWWLGYANIKEALQAGEQEELFLIKDIAVHGCSGGVTGLCYYHQTTSFYDAYEEDVWKYVRESAEAAGESLFFLLDKNIDTPSSFKNSMAWLAVECAAQELDAAKEN